MKQVIRVNTTGIICLKKYIKPVSYTHLCYAGQVAFGGPLTSDLFGSKNFGFNFSILLWAPTAATAISPWLAAAGKGTFFMFGICALSCILSITCALLLRKLRKDNLEVVYKIKN